LRFIIKIVNLFDRSQTPIAPSRQATALRLGGMAVRAAAACSLLLAGIGAVRPPEAHATVFYARNELMQLAFPDADQVQAIDFFLEPAEREAIEARASARLDSDLVTVYVGREHGVATGYAIIDTHTVRTMPETLLSVVSPDGSLSAIYMVAFYEPLEYLPSERWLARLSNRQLADELRVGRGVAGITGSTLSSRAVVDAVRRALAIHAVLIGERR